MPPDPFRAAFLPWLDALRGQVAADDGTWTVKGFIDIYQRIYTVSLDTKVLSKVLELLLLPVIADFAQDSGYRITPAKAQNQYPDLSLVSTKNKTDCYAIDVKTTYRTGAGKDGLTRVNGMTLGTFQGYFRNRDQPSGSTFAYNCYRKHYVLGVIYSRAQNIDEQRTYPLAELQQIPSVAYDFRFFFHEKYKIAADTPGSGNTKNIGSTRYEDRLLNGTGVFAKLGVEVFDDYWMHYQTRAMAQESGHSAPPYTNLKAYQAYKKHGAQILTVPDDEIESEADGDDPQF